MKTVFLNCTLLDGTKTMEPRPNMTVTVDGENIFSVEEGGRPAEGDHVIDLAGRYLLPGLINLHVHLPANGRPKKKQTDPKKLAKLLMSNPVTRAMARNLCANYAKTELLSGVTTIRTVGGVGSIDTQVRDGIAAGKLDGPRVLASNMAVSVPGGHMAESLAYAAKSAADARADVLRIAEDHPDLIKLMITGGVLDAKVMGEPGVLKMPADYVRACCEEAHRLGYQVAAHVESTEGVRVALENGVDTIEHGAKLDDSLVALFKERGAKHVCTLSPALPYALFDREIARTTEMEQYNGRVVFDGIAACAKTALENDIPVGIGTDTGCPYTTHYDMWRELIYFCKFVGVTPQFALYTATLRNAEIAGIADKTGSVAPGKAADLLIIDKNPLEDLTALRTPRMVVARGRLYKSPVVKKFPEVERELDKFL